MELKIDVDQFRYVPGKSPLLKDQPTKVKDFYDDKSDYIQDLDRYTSKIQKLQAEMYAHDRYALLLIFQGMDTAGKDGAIKHVMSGINPAGVQVYSFKKPTDQELDHDWMWRTTCCLPERGRIGIFNRSYYEEVLVVKVHPKILREYQRIPKELIQDEAKVWEDRYSDINHFEDFLYRNGTRVVKFFLNISKDEQKERLLARIDEPEKNWKMSIADVDERQHWDAYQGAYQDLLAKTSTSNAPWYVVPANDKKNARLIISQVVLHELEKMGMHYPEVTEEFRQKLQAVRDVLSQEK